MVLIRHERWFHAIRRVCYLAIPLFLLTACHRYGAGVQTEEARGNKAVQVWSDAYEKYEKQGDYERAITAYQNALAISPRPVILYHLGHCYAQTGDYGRARNYLRQALEMKPDYELAQVELARVNSLDPEGAKRSGAPMPALKPLGGAAAPTESAPIPAPTAGATRTTQLEALTQPAGRPSEAAPAATQAAPAASQPTRLETLGEPGEARSKAPVLLVDDGSAAPAATVDGRVPQALPDPRDIKEIAPVEQAQPTLPPLPGGTVATATPKAGKSREDDVRPEPTLQKITEAGATAAPTVRSIVLPTPSPTPAKGELPPIIITRPRGEATAVPSVTASATPLLQIAELTRPTTKPTVKPSMPTPTPAPTPAAAPTARPRVVVSVPTATPEPTEAPATLTPTPAPTSAPPSIEDVQKTLFPAEKPAERPAPAVRPTPAGEAPEGAAGASLNSFAYHFEQGDKFLEHKEYARAIDELERALSFDPRHLEGLLKLGDAYKAAGRTQQALKQYQQSVEYYPREPRTYLKIGNLYINDKTPENQKLARLAYQKAVDVDPQYKQAYNNLGIIDMQGGQIDSAISNFQKVIAIDNDYPNAHLNLGILFEEYKRDPFKAYYHYQEYVRLGGKRSDEVRKWMEALNKGR